MQEKKLVSENVGPKLRREAAPLPSLARVGNTIFSAVQQQDYSATIWLRRRDHLERWQQKCIAVFALVCCFAVLMALIFSAVDLWGEDEDGITEENCSKNCRIVLVENIPDDLSFPHNGLAHLPLFSGLNGLLDQAKHSVEIVSSHWALTSEDHRSWPPSANQGQFLFQRLLGLKSRGVKLKVVSDHVGSVELKSLSERNAEVRYINMTALTKGRLRSSFWVVDRKHIYIGSASMDWKSLSKMKELGVIVYNCSCIALDLHRIFSFYWQLEYKDYIPSIWSKRVTALFSRASPLALCLNHTDASAYVASSPDLFCPKDRTRDIDAIHHVIRLAKKFIYISITDYLPLVNRTFRGSMVTRYWSAIDEMLREAVVLRGVKVCVLISLWEHTHPLTFNFMTSLQSLCLQLVNCSVEVKFFIGKEQLDGSLQRVSHNKFMVTDNALYIGNLDWVGDEFAYNAGTSLVIKSSESHRDGESSIVEQVTAAFERDWFSPYAKLLQMKSRVLTGSDQKRLYMTAVNNQSGNKENE
ncbi:inactive phospholipase D5 [Chanos chanos]|uniref:Inactive phospholipase D5 n=1 Tax=Chanos chanos TaxID=29144 RepID=A0A6J2W2X5_CHACN|nr:inactive phospholipase D5-like [Chanos chanos]